MAQVMPLALFSCDHDVCELLQTIKALLTSLCVLLTPTTSLKLDSQRASMDYTISTLGHADTTARRGQASGLQAAKKWLLRHYMFILCIVLHCLLIFTYLALGLVSVFKDTIVKHDTTLADLAVFVYNIVPNIVFKVCLPNSSHELKVRNFPVVYDQSFHGYLRASFQTEFPCQADIDRATRENCCLARRHKRGVDHV